VTSKRQSNAFRSLLSLNLAKLTSIIIGGSHTAKIEIMNMRLPTTPRLLNSMTHILRRSIIGPSATISSQSCTRPKRTTSEPVSCSRVMCLPCIIWGRLGRKSEVIVYPWR
jgi:hypothetical protein